jgi:uncharacterized protein (DUF3084 family)
MTTAYILITAILIIGGLIATVGDRIGTRVGKKRLSLFKLRPKNTAVLVTILTGVGIAGSTLGILFLIDDGLRKGVFELENIQKDLRRKREQLKGAETQITQVTGELSEAKNQQAEAQKRLEDTNKYLLEANKKQKQTQAQLNRTITQQAQTLSQLRGTQSRLGEVESRYQQAAGQYLQARSQLENLNNERKKLQQEILQQKAESEQLFNRAKAAIAEAKAAIQTRDRELAKRKNVIEERDRKIASLDQLIQERNLEITAREQVIAQRESRLKDLEAQQTTLAQEVARLEKYYQSFRDLRLGKLALIRGQVIASAVVSVQQPTAAREAVIKLLQEANRNAVVGLTEPGSNPPADFQILQISNEQIQLLAKQISNGREYVVRVFSAGNYVRGEKRIEFFTDATLNQIVFKAGEVLASTTADPKTMTSYQMRQRLDLLISASQFRARNAGILNDIQIDSTFLRFVSQLRQFQQPIEVQAIAAENTYTAGPLRVKLIAIQNGQVIFST